MSTRAWTGRGARVASWPRIVAAHGWAAVSGGRFFSWSTLLASGIVAVAIMSPYIGREGLVEILEAMLASLLAWLAVVVAVLPAAVAERSIRSRAGRGAVVLGALVVVAVARPFLNDGIASALFGHASTGEWPQRIATNALIWFTLLPLVAAARAWYVDARNAASRLTAALAVFDDLRRRISRYAEANSALLADEVAGLRGRRDALLAEPVDFDVVRAFADEVRATSHRLDERLQVPLDHGAGYAVPSSRGRGAGGILAQLARPPAALIAGIYLVASVPYMYIVGGWPLILLALVVLSALAGAADLATRLLSRGRGATARGAVIVGCWAVVGAAMMAAGILLTSVEGVVLLVPLLSLPGLAIVVAFGTHALQRVRQDDQTLTHLPGTTSAIVTAQTARAREPLWRAVDLLHDRVQARCVIFAARVDERPPTDAEIDDFRTGTDAAFAEILGGAPVQESEEDDLDGLLAIWSGVLDVRAQIDPPAMAALQSRTVAAAVVAAVGEGFVNAVKHSAARTVRLSVTGGPGAVTVAVSSPGQLGAVRTPGLGLASFGDRARLRQDGEDVVLEVIVPAD
jgi:hypothetical protein